MALWGWTASGAGHERMRVKLRPPVQEWDEKGVKVLRGVYGPCLRGVSDGVVQEMLGVQNPLFLWVAMSCI